VNDSARKKGASGEKTRNSGNWTQARYNSFVRSALRGAFRRWQPKYDVLKDAYTRVKQNKASGRQAKHYRCAVCKKEWPLKQMSVDHKTPIGTFTSWDDFIERLYCEKTNLQALCKKCHLIKSNKEKKENKNKK
jgi:5-methylcytosine-specific restriction endonuclease McrA